MKKILLVTLFAISCVLNGFGQSCLPNGITFTTQAQINNFATNYPGCSEIVGDVVITGAGISNLNGLSTITSVRNITIMQNPGLTSLSGLQNLTNIGLSLNILENPALTSIAALGGLNSVQGIYIDANNSLANLAGLENIDSLNYDLFIQNNNTLTSIAGLQNLTDVRGGSGFYIRNNPLLSSLAGLEHLASVRTFYIESSPLLTNLTGLNNLVKASSLSIQGNASLASIAELSNLSSVAYLSVYSNPMLQNLNGLEQITSLNGLYIIDNASLVNVDALGELTSVESDFSISNNPVLTNLNGMAKLQTIGANFSISGNNILTNLSGFANLSFVRGVVEIAYNPALTSLVGLENITIDSALIISNNPLLTNLAGLENMKKIKGWLGIYNNDGLINLSGLNNLTQFSNLYIQDNDALLNLDALGNVNTPLYGLSIINNNSLTSLNGLHNIPSIGSNVNLYGNHSLSDCAIFAVCNLLLNEPDQINELFDNAPGCDTQSEAADMCHGSPVTVFVLLDQNSNQLPLGDIRVKFSGLTQMHLKPTDATGMAQFVFLETGIFSVSLPDVSDTQWVISNSTSIYASSTGSDSTVMVLLLTAFTQCPALKVTLGMPSFFRGCLVNSDLGVSTQNMGTDVAENVIVAFVLPPVLELLSAVPPVSTQVGDTLFFNMGDVLPFSKADVKLSVRTRCDTFLLGQSLCIEAFAALENACPTTLPAFSEIKLSVKCIGDTIVRFTIKNIGDAPTQGWHAYKIIRNGAIQYDNAFQLNAQQSLAFDFPADGATWRMEATKFDDGTETAVALENCGGLTPGWITAFWQDHGPLEYDFDCRQVVGSYDPNLKTAVPVGVGWYHTIAANKPILYTIDFQNTGTDTAFRVLLRDKLPSVLDVTTFRPLFSSHPCTWEIRGNTLEVLFSPIALPDSNVNEPASHGFFSFELDQKPNLPNGTYFQNFANIIFDFNPAIWTNTTYHQVGKLAVQVDEPQKVANFWQVLGNPTRDVALFKALDFIDGDKQFALFDVAGKQVRLAQFSGQEFEFRRDMLGAGVYFFRVSDERNGLFTGKIIITD